MSDSGDRFIEQHDRTEVAIPDCICELCNERRNRIKVTTVSLDEVRELWQSGCAMMNDQYGSHDCRAKKKMEKWRRSNGPNR